MMPHFDMITMGGSINYPLIDPDVEQKDAEAVKPPPANANRIHPVQNSVNLHDNIADSKQIDIPPNSTAYELVLRKLESIHESFYHPNGKTQMTLVIPDYSAPYIYVKSTSKYCVLLERFHKRTTAECKMYIRQKNVENVKTLSNEKVADDFKYTDSMGFTEIGIIAMYFICWSQDCVGNCKYIPAYSAMLHY